MTLCNLSIEGGARFGMIAPDEITFDYVRGRRFAPKGDDWDAALDGIDAHGVPARTLKPGGCFGSPDNRPRARLAGLRPGPAGLLQACRFARLSGGKNFSCFECRRLDCRSASGRLSRDKPWVQC